METDSNLKAVFFDVDGTLIDTEKIQSDAFLYVLTQHGHHETSLTEHGTVHIPGEQTHETWSRLKSRHDIPTEIDELTELKRQAAMNALGAELDAMDGVVGLFDELRNNGIKIAVVSSAQKERLDRVIGGLGLSSHVDAIISANDVDRVKPAPDPYLAAADKFHISPDNCIVIEDAEVGVLSAKAAGMKVIAVPNAYTLNMDFSSADMRVDSLKELSVSILNNLALS